MKKVIFCDIDNTLARFMSSISQKNIKAIVEYIKNGGKFILSTGRASYSAIKFLNEINRKLPVEFHQNTLIASNGGCIYQTGKEQTISEIDDKIVRVIYDFCNSKKIWILCYTSMTYAKRTALANSSWFGVIFKICKNLGIRKIKQNDVLTSNKIVLASVFTKKIDDAQKYIQSELNEFVDCYRSNERVLEINVKGVNKGFAIKKILSEFDIKKTEAIAIGDSRNDIPAFNEVGTSFAVKTKQEIVKKSATHYIPFFKNAVAEVIKKYVLIEDGK